MKFNIRIQDMLISGGFSNEEMWKGINLLNSVQYLPRISVSYYMRIVLCC